MKMEEIQHSIVEVDGQKLHIAEKGDEGGPTLLFLHGFPELWYSWRHQMSAFSSKGYHTIALDLRGYGDSNCPTSVSSYTCFHLVGDVVGLLDLLGVGQVYLVAHDMGALVGWYLCLFRPDRVLAFVSLSVPFQPRHPKLKPIPNLRAVFGEEYYMCRFQEEGEIEKEIAKYGAKHVLRKILTTRDPSAPLLPKGRAFDDQDSSTLSLPSWLSEDDLNYYASKYEANGFTGPLNYYRNLDRNWELTAAWTGAKVKVPSMLIVGSLDMVYNMVGVKEYVHNGGFKEDVPLLQNVVVMDDVGHFINQERPTEVNDYILDFITNF